MPLLTRMWVNGELHKLQHPTVSGLISFLTVFEQCEASYLSIYAQSKS